MLVTHLFSYVTCDFLVNTLVMILVCVCLGAGWAIQFVYFSLYLNTSMNTPAEHLPSWTTRLELSLAVVTRC